MKGLGKMSRIKGWKKLKLAWNDESGDIIWKNEKSGVRVSIDYDGRVSSDSFYDVSTRDTNYEWRLMKKFKLQVDAVKFATTYMRLYEDD